VNVTLPAPPWSPPGTAAGDKIQCLWRKKRKCTLQTANFNYLEIYYRCVPHTQVDLTNNRFVVTIFCSREGSCQHRPRER